MKKALVFGLGLLGGGIATTNWLIRHGYEVTVTDLKDEKQLAPSLKKIKGKVNLALGGHGEELIRDNDLIAVNQDVSISNKYVVLARKLGKKIVSESSLFLENWNKKIAAVTGTRGKTTTVNWINHFLNSKFKSVVAGNSYQKPFLEVIDSAQDNDWAVLELPSAQLEYFDDSIKSPDIAVITNIFQDHLNRHGTMENYAAVKANIFRNQKSNQFLILNKKNAWTPYFLKQNPKSLIRFFSSDALESQEEVLDSERLQKYINIEDFKKNFGKHNLENLLASILAARSADCSWDDIRAKIKTLPAIEFRQEIVFKNDKLTIINDTTATSPDGGIAAIERFGGDSCILIAGGTDRELDFTKWAKTVKEKIKPGHLILLSGSATDKIIKLLGKDKLNIFDSLEQCFNEAVNKVSELKHAVILFSPGAKSFEKFLNEYDRGDKFNELVKSRFG